MGYQHLQNVLKAIALTVPAARAFEMTVEFILGEARTPRPSAASRITSGIGRR